MESIVAWPVGGRSGRSGGLFSTLAAAGVFLVVASFGYARPVWDPWRDPREYVERHARGERAIGRRGRLTTGVAQRAPGPTARRPLAARVRRGGHGRPQR